MTDPADRQMFAAVDLGSNSFHLVVARREHGQLHIIDRIREMVRLAAGLDENGRLEKEARTRALECLARFGQRLSGIPADHVRALGTNTFRQATDAHLFLDEAEQSLGHPIEIVSGHEEARLVYLGVAEGMAPSNHRRLVIDIGGGSTELIVGQGRDAEALDTIALGCVAVSAEFFPGGQVTRKAMKAAQTRVALELRPVRDTYRRGRWQDAVGSSGTIRAVGRVLAQAGWTDGSITPSGLKRLRRAMESVEAGSRLELPGLSDQRRPVFPGGVAILSSCFRNLDIETMSVSDSALREGALYDLIGRIEHRDPRETSVEALAKRYGVDRKQSNRVRATALQAFDATSATWELTGTDRARLDWASRLHEIGLAIAHDRYHRHGAYLVQHSDLNGFSREEQLVLSTLIFTHRRKLAPEMYNVLPERIVRPTMFTSALLRIAVLLHRSRLPDALPPVQWEAGPEALAVTFPANWLEDHPLTGVDLIAERQGLSNIGIALVFE